MKKTLRPESIDKLKNLSIRLLDQRESTPLIMPQENSEGFWFGGGNFIQQEDGTILTCGRYRNHGDARTEPEQGNEAWSFPFLKSIKPRRLPKKSILFLNPIFPMMQMWSPLREAVF